MPDIALESVTPSAGAGTDNIVVRRGAGPADHTMQLVALSSKAEASHTHSAADLTLGTLPAARFDDTAHGARSGGTLHADVVAAGASGFMTGADKTKLDGVAAGAQVNVATDLAYTAGTRLLASSTGADVTLPLVASADAGLAPASGGGTANFLRADGTWAAPAGGGATNLTYTAATRVVASDTGTDATLPLFTATDAGLAPLSGGGTANFLRADGSWSAPAGGGDMVLASAQTNTALKTFLDGTFGLRNVANTFTMLMTTTATAARTYTLKDASGTLAFVSDITGINSGTNTGDQASIAGITGTKAQFDTAVTDGNFLYVGDVTQYTDELAQDAVGVMVDASLTYVDATPLLQRAALTGHITAAAGSNATLLGSFTKAQLDTAVSDGNVLYTGDVTQYTDELAQDAVGAMVATSLVYNDAGATLQRAALTGHVTAAQDSNALVLGSFTKAQLDTAVSDGNVLYVGDVTSNATHTGDVTGSGALTIDPTAISGKTLVTAVGADHVLILDATDGLLKKALASDLAGGGGVSDGDKGDITVSGSGTVWTVDALALVLRTDAAASVTPVLTDDNRVVLLSNAAPTFNVPTNAAVAFQTGAVIEVRITNAGTFAWPATVTVNGTAGASSFATTAGSVIRAWKTGTNDWTVDVSGSSSGASPIISWMI